MSSYTMQLREMVEMATQRAEPYSLSTREKIEKGREVIFDFNYPIFDESYRHVFENHFIRNFYMREIGFETEGLFKFRLETWLQINMPYFNKLFESEMLDYNPLQNSEMENEYNKKNDKDQNDKRNTKQNSETDGTSQNKSNQSSSGNASDNSFDRNIEANTPDGRLHLTTNDGSGVLEYASKINENTGKDTRKTDSKGNSTSDDTTNVKSNADQNDTLDSKINETEDYLQHRIGKIGVVSYPKLIMEHREAFLRIERQIFDEMNELFMLVY